MINKLLINTGPRPDLTVLPKFPCKNGKQKNIIEETAPHYKDIGTFLLHDERGNIVKGIEGELRNTPVMIMTDIYEKWLVQYGGTWKELIQCLRDCELTVLAGNIEDGLEKSSGKLLSSVVHLCT